MYRYQSRCFGNGRFYRKFFIPTKCTRVQYDENSILETPEENISIEFANNSVILVLDNFIDYGRINIFGGFQKDALNLAMSYPFFQKKYDTIYQELMTTHIPAKFKTKFLEQMHIDQLVSQDIDDIVSIILTSYSNAKEYKKMPLNMLVSHFMGGNLNLKCSILTLLLLYDSQTKHIATILFDYLLNEDSLCHTIHNIYCQMHWTIQKEFEFSYKEMEYQVKTFQNIDKIPYDKKLLLSNATNEAKEKAGDKLKAVNSPEGGSKAQSWLDGFLKIPFGQYKSHDIIDKLDEFKCIIPFYVKHMQMLHPTYDTVVTKKCETSHQIKEFFRNIKEIHDKMNPVELDSTPIKYTIVSETKSDKRNLGGDSSGGNNVWTLKSLIETKRNDMLSKFSNIFKDDDTTSTSVDEKISIVNGSFKKTRTYRAVSHDIIENTDMPQYVSSTFFSQKSIFYDLNILYEQWETYEQEKKCISKV